MKRLSRVFVYGTLMSGMENHVLIKPYVIAVQRAMTRGLIYDLPYGYPAMTPGNGVVYGEILELRDLEKALALLDDLEDYRGEGEENLYNRVVQEVITTSGIRFTAYVYLWARPHTLTLVGKLLPEGQWRP